jgi:hypothetical protein
VEKGFQLAAPHQDPIKEKQKDFLKHFKPEVLAMSLKGK